MKKFFILFLSLVLILSLSSCNDEFKGKVFNATVIGSNNDFISVSTIDNSVDFLEADIEIKKSSLSFSIENGMALKIEIKKHYLNNDNTLVVKPAVIEKIDIKIKNITQEEAFSNLENYVFLDLRSQDEFKRGHIKNSINIPFEKLRENYESVLNNKDENIIVYSKSEKTAELASKLLASQGYKNINNMGSIMGWQYGVVTD